MSGLPPAICYSGYIEQKQRRRAIRSAPFVFSQPRALRQGNMRNEPDKSGHTELITLHAVAEPTRKSREKPPKPPSLPAPLPSASASASPGETATATTP